MEVLERPLVDEFDEVCFIREDLVSRYHAIIFSNDGKNLLGSLRNFQTGDIDYQFDFRANTVTFDDIACQLITEWFKLNSARFYSGLCALQVSKSRDDLRAAKSEMNNYDNL